MLDKNGRSGEKYVLELNINIYRTHFAVAQEFERKLQVCGDC